MVWHSPIKPTFRSNLLSAELRGSLSAPWSFSLNLIIPERSAKIHPHDCCAIDFITLTLQVNYWKQWHKHMWWIYSRPKTLDFYWTKMPIARSARRSLAHLQWRKILAGKRCFGFVLRKVNVLQVDCPKVDPSAYVNIVSMLLCFGPENCVCY